MSQIMRLCYLKPFLLKYLHKTSYYIEILDWNIESEMYFYCWWVLTCLSDCAISDQRGKWYEKKILYLCWWQFCWITSVKFNNIQSIPVWLLHITQFTVCATKNLTVFVADSPRCLEWSKHGGCHIASPAWAVRAPVGWTRSPWDRRSHSGHVGNTRRRRLITCCRLWPAARRFWPGVIASQITRQPKPSLLIGLR